MAREKETLNKFERRIEAEIERGEWKPVVPQRRQEIREAARRTLVELKKSGGERRHSGADRKNRDRVAVTIRVKKETKAFLARQAKGGRGIGSIIDRMVEVVAAKAAKA